MLSRRQVLSLAVISVILLSLFVYLYSASNNVRRHFSSTDVHLFRNLDLVDFQPNDREKNMMELYFRKIRTKTYECKNMRRFGHFSDGGWEVCLDKPFQFIRPCLVYSFGINNDWSFDDAIDQGFGCEIHAYDPSMNVGHHNRSKNIQFHPIGLAGEDGRMANWIVRKFSTIKKQLGHNKKTIDFVKIDVELSEWSALAAIMRDGGFDNVRQLAIEYHLPELDLAAYGQSRAELLEKYLDILVGLEKAGFRIYHTHTNPVGIYMNHILKKYVNCCDEVYYVNTKLKKNKS